MHITLHFSNINNTLMNFCVLSYNCEATHVSQIVPLMKTNSIRSSLKLANVSSILFVNRIWKNMEHKY